MADYTQYGGMSAELAQLLPYIPALPENLTVQQLKAAQNSAREEQVREEMKQLGDRVVIKDHAVPARDGSTIEARSYRPADKPADAKLPIFVYFHGGGFLLGTLGTEDATCARIVLDVGCVVFNVNYRHTPEHRFPVAWDDSEDGFDWAYQHADEFGGDNTQIVVGGISAGGQLTASLVQTKKREGSPAFASIKGQVLMIPCLVDEQRRDKLFEKLKDPKASSWVENENAPLLPVSRVKLFTQLLIPQDTVLGEEDRRVNPGAASLEEVKGLPPATFGIAGLDPLRDEALLYAEHLAQSG